MFTVVPEVSTVPDSHTTFAIGFEPERNINVDATLPQAKDTYNGSFGKLFTNGNPTTKVQLFSHTAGEHNTLIETIQNYQLPEDLGHYKNLFNIPLSNDKLVIKVSPIKTYRDLMTCYKEAIMTQKIYTRERNNVVGADLVCKPFACCPMDLRRKGWAFVTITSLANGISCSKMLNIFQRIFHKVSMKEVYIDVATVCDQFWRLGFVHNDLHPGNVVYNPKTHKVTLVDLETVVELPEDVIAQYVEARAKSKTIHNCYVTFNHTILQPALNLLRHSETWLNEFTSKEAGYCRGIYNVDSNFLCMLQP